MGGSGMRATFALSQASSVQARLGWPRVSGSVKYFGRTNSVVFPAADASLGSLDSPFCWRFPFSYYQTALINIPYVRRIPIKLSVQCVQMPSWTDCFFHTNHTSGMRNRMRVRANQGVQRW
jgi:hypothetical protein